MRRPFSYTAPRLDEEVETREFQELDREKKDEINDDLFGRNVDQTQERNSRQILQGELDEMEAAVEAIPLADRIGHSMATIHCPDLLETETDPRLFLIREDFDPFKAASRLVEYWNLRVEIFGDERAFLPMTLDGALYGDSSLIQMISHFPNFRTFLPNDSHGRTVILSAPSCDAEEFNVFDCNTWMRYIWYNVHIALRRPSTILRGIVYIFVGSPHFNLDLFDRIKQKMLVRSTLCFPVTIRAVHYLSLNHTLQSLILPVVKFFMNQELRQRIVHHIVSTPEEIVDSAKACLPDYGIPVENIPTILGGDYELNLNWLQDEFEFEFEEQQQNNNSTHAYGAPLASDELSI
mmetsp:Transcript_5449/g.8299  ORF Transcript_5449/g.8299 Transcript_5449/m.8299 type:complete len:350 (+) Transcript_5449:16-1065(+)